MTDPTPEQMRELSDVLDRCADNDRNPVRVPLLHESASALRAAADEVDRLRAVIGRAPHEDECCHLEEDVVEPYGTRISPHARCTCWKADAL